jgi:putative SOS response-associated peptidase YedK
VESKKVLFEKPSFKGLVNRSPSRDCGTIGDPAGDKELCSFTLITTEPNALVRPIKNRMPVIYDRELGAQWLEHSFGGRLMTLTAMMQPLPSELMDAHEVSTLVNSPENDTAECIALFLQTNPLNRSYRSASKPRASGYFSVPAYAHGGG